MSRALRGGFTLIELMIAILIAVMIVLAAAPSLSGIIEERKAKKLFEQFDELAREAGQRAVIERRAYVLEWDDSGVTMHPKDPNNPTEAQGTQRVDFGDRQAPDLDLPGALVKNPPKIWTFWPTGTCEPATIVCHIADSPWTASYDALTEQPYYTSP
jgi:prepilin-type N-terminal cleavage/methylation domain-containing protein